MNDEMTHYRGLTIRFGFQFNFSHTQEKRQCHLVQRGLPCDYHIMLVTVETCW